MPIGYLITVALIALGTMFALAPPRQPPALAAIGFRFGLVVNELPFVAFLVVAASTALALGDSEIDSPGGWVVVGVAALTIAGLSLVVWRAGRTGPAVQRALSEALGPDWRFEIDAGMTARLRRRLPLARILFWPFPWPRPGAVERIKNVSYGDAGRSNLLDVYRHRSHPAGAPTLVYVHGGGYHSGRKSREGLPLSHRLASQGWVCISANYRLSPAAAFPDQVVDLKKVIAWVRQHADEYGMDPATVFVAGSSAGGHMASIAALTPNDPAFQPGFEDADTSVAAAISLSGYLGTSDGRDSSSSPAAHVRPDAPPFFLAQGDRDTYSPGFVSIARDFAAKLHASSTNPVVYAELPDAQHSFDLFHSIRFETVVDGIEAFTAWVRSTRGGETRSRPGFPAGVG